jgi:hypothetical protein
MSKKLWMGLAPMLAALAMIPAVAHATPHYYRNGVLIPAGEQVPVLEWGTLVLSPEPPVGGTSCNNLGGGYVENPVGGGAGIGATLRFDTYNCANAECPAGLVEVGGKLYEKEFEVVYPPQDFPWPSVLLEPEAGVVRTNSTGFVMQLACMAHGFSRLAAGEGNPSEGSKAAGESEQFVLPSGGPPTVTCVTDETHKREPHNEKGTNDGPNQSRLSFDSGAGLVSCAGGAFEGRTQDVLRIMGFKNSELITEH